VGGFNMFATELGRGGNWELVKMEEEDAKKDDDDEKKEEGLEKSYIKYKYTSILPRHLYIKTHQP
jgi:hypothetical protein